MPTSAIPELAVAAARRLRPSAGAGDIRPLGEGQMSVAVLIDDIVLRFPRSDFARQRLKREVQLLERLRPVLGRRVPEVLGADLDGTADVAFVAHRLLPGEPLAVHAVASLRPEAVARIGDAVGDFLRELHGLNETVGNVGLPVLTIRQFAESLRAETETLLHPRMSDTGRRRADRELDAVAHLPDAPVALCHTDIGGAVVYDDVSEAVGFIDFGSAMVTDPVLDVASLSVLGDALLDRCAATYPLIAERLQDAAVVRETFVLQDALYGARQSDWAHVDAVLEQYETS